MNLPRSVFAAGFALALLTTSCTANHAIASEAEQVADALELEIGMRVADVGAGDGEWSVELAARVGETGHVYATEVDEDDLEDVRQRFAKAGLDNATAILGDQEHTGLPADCCDAILLRLVYHHFIDPAPMRASLRRALRRRGLIAVIDILPQSSWHELPGVPDRGGHGISPEEVLADMTGDGFELVARFDDWGDEEDHFCIVFRRVEPDGREPASGS